MRSKIVMLLLLLILIFIGTEAQNRGPRYENRTLHKEKKGLKKHDYTPVTVDMSYPYFTGKDSDAKFLNAEVSKYLFEEYKTFDKFCLSFFRDHLRDGYTDRLSNWKVTKAMEVVFSSSSLLSLTAFYEKQEGLNIFLERYSLMSYDVLKQTRLTLESVFKGDNDSILLPVVWSMLNQLKDGSDRFIRFYPEVSDKVLSKQYYFTDKEVVMAFAKGEIAHQIYGGFEVRVPYESVKSLMKKDSVIWDLLSSQKSKK